MSESRKIIEINEELCDGCGQCIISCAEGALEIVDGKAKLVSDIYCDGLGACLGECPTGALELIEREADGFDEEAVEERLEELKEKPKQEPAMACGCPGTMIRTFEQEEPSKGDAAEQRSELKQWPIKLQLLGPQVPFLKNSDLVLLADCVGVSDPNLHQKLVKDHTIAIGCPKLDDLEAHIDRLAQILEGAEPRSLTVAHMEVPCCRGFVHAAEEAIKRSGVDVPLKRVQIGIKGEVQAEEDLNEAAKRAVG